MILWIKDLLHRMSCKGPNLMHNVLLSKLRSFFSYVAWLISYCVRYASCKGRFTFGRSQAFVSAVVTEHEMSMRSNGRNLFTLGRWRGACLWAPHSGAEPPGNFQIFKYFLALDFVLIVCPARTQPPGVNALV